ncbi:MAG: ParB/RepB/Spo0J family partition protein [Planctomycetes bacterium]|nr:ParB/RepB/Spo0J family partition protein [Planctomycetota bacterium]
MKERRLGKGLEFLLGESPAPAAQGAEGELLHIHPDDLRPNRFQPRTNMDPASIDALAASIKERGVLQPIVVRKTDSGFELVAGERRWRACKSLGMTAIPALVREFTDKEALGVALVENVQREDLSPIEKGKAYLQLIKLFNLTQEEVAQRMGLDRSTVANFVRLLELPPEIQEHVSRGTLSMGHARALLGMAEASQMVALSRRVLLEGMTVRRLEAAVRSASKGGAKPAKEKPQDANLADLEDRLRRRLGTKVRLRHGRRKGKIEIEYYSTQDLNRIVELLQA